MKMLDETNAVVTAEEAPWLSQLTAGRAQLNHWWASFYPKWVEQTWGCVKCQDYDGITQCIQQTFSFRNAGLLENQHSVVLVLDGASIVKGTRLTEPLDMSCTAHTLHLLVNDGLSSQRAVCAGHYCHIEELCRLLWPNWELGLWTYGIIQAVQTRWNSTLHMLQRTYEQWCTLKVHANEHGHISCLSAAQWNIMSNLTDTLEPLEVTLEMSHSESYALCIILSVSETDAGSSAGIKTLWKTMLDKAILQDKGPYKGQCLHFSRDIRESKRMAERSSCTWNEKRLVKQRASKKTDDTSPTLVGQCVCKTSWSSSTHSWSPVKLQNWGCVIPERASGWVPGLWSGGGKKDETLKNFCTGQKISLSVTLHCPKWVRVQRGRAQQAENVSSIIISNFSADSEGK